MNTNSTYSLSLQRQFKNKGMDTDINLALRGLKLGSILRRSNIMKQKGYATQTLMFFILLLPFIKRTLCTFWTAEWINKQVEAQKVTW